MLLQHEYTPLVQSGYLILSYHGPYCSCIKNIDGQDRYVLLKFQDGKWVVLTQ